MNLSLSLEGLSFIESWEKFRDKVYQDSAGLDTIGFGHKCLKGEIWPVAGIDIERARKVLLTDLQDPSRAVRILVHVPIEQHHFDALVSFTFNLGQGSLRISTLLKKINASGIKAAAEEFERWDHAGGQESNGLLVRRKAEKEIFLNGVYVNHA